MINICTMQSLRSPAPLPHAISTPPDRAPSPSTHTWCSNVGKAGVVKSAHEFLLPMVVTGRGGKVMLAGEQQLRCI